MQHRISTTPELRMAMALNRARMIAAACRQFDIDLDRSQWSVVDTPPRTDRRE